MAHARKHLSRTQRAGSGRSTAFVGKASQYELHVGERGRLVLPAKVRGDLGLKSGEHMVLTIEAGGRLVLTRLREQVRRTRGIFRGVAPGVSLADELIRERREEAARETKR